MKLRVTGGTKFPTCLSFVYSVNFHRLITTITPFINAGTSQIFVEKIV